MKKNWVLPSLISFNGISILGNGLSEFVIPWLILQMTDSPTYVGLILGARFIPGFLSTIIGGGLIDRYGSIKISQYSDILNFFAVAAIPLLFVYEQLDMGILVVLVFFSSVLDSPGRAAKDVLFADQLDTPNVLRERWNGFNSLVESACDALGPLLAGILISLYGLVNVLWFDAFSFIIPVIGLVILQKYLTHEPQNKNQTKAQFSDWFTGFKYIYQHPETLLITLLSATVSMALSTLLFLYLPIFSKNILQSTVDQGVIMLCFTVGTMASTLLFSLVGDRFNYKKLLIYGLLGLSLSVMIINYADGFWSFSISIFMVGLFLGFSGPLEAGYLQKTVPKAMRGKVFSAYGGLRQLLVPLSAPFIGYYLEFISPIAVVDGVVNMPNIMLALGLVILTILMIYAYKYKLTTDL